MTFETFLREAWTRGAAVRLRPMPARGGGIEFHAHLDGEDAPAVGFAVVTNQLVPLDRGAGD